MSVDRLQDKIRKTKNPSVLFLEAIPNWLPAPFAEQPLAEAFAGYFRELLTGLKGILPCVRFGFGSFAMLGAEGMEVLKSLMTYAREQDYYVLMDLPELLTPNAAASAVKAVADFDCDGVVAGCYLGSDVLTPLTQLCRDGKSVFGVCRTANRSAVELQDLLTGGRHSHTAAADVIFRFAEPVMAKCGYSQLGIVAGASSAQSLKTLRSKFPKLFLLLDGYDYPNANAKNCENAFDRLGHGAAACASSSIAAAWMIAEEGGDYVQQAIEAAQRMKKNLTRYVTIL